MPLALAVVAFIYAEIVGLKDNGIGYLSKFFNIKAVFKAKGVMDIFTAIINLFIGLLELISEIIRIVSLSFRLFGNMTAGEILLLVAMFLIPWLFAVPFYGLELLIGFIQALIFGGLTLIYATVAVTPHEEEAH